MDVKFGIGQQPVEQAVPVAAATPAAAPSQVPATVQSGPPATNSLLLGDKLPSFSDVILPRLNIVQNIGGLMESFDPGALVLNQTLELFIPQLYNAKTQTVERVGTPPVIITVLGFKPMRFTEKVAGGARGMIVNTEADVRAAGGTLDYGEWELKKEAGMKRFEPLADALVLIERPAKCKPENNAEDPTFVYEVEGKFYALAFWALRGSAYTAACKRVLFPARLSGCLRKGGYQSWAFSLATREETYRTGNKAWVPVLLPTAPNTAQMINFVAEVLNPKSDTSGAQ